MEKPIIEATNISKLYKIGNSKDVGKKYLALRDVISEKTSKIFSKFKSQESSNSIVPEITNDFYALKNISFNINKGDRVGIIGRNGAGKSTLLKVLSRITEPSDGTLTIRGRIASLLEVGTGFHPELTARENIFLNGSILGMTRNEIKSKFQQIVDFAEVEKFLDTPVKRFSSGMYVRLAFSVAAHLEPEILLVDEVLAVGDAQFQKKCLGKMEEVSSQEGRTILFVSHNMSAIANLCPKSILIDGGEIKFIGNTIDAINLYNSEIVKMDLSWEGDQGNEFARIKKAYVSPLEEIYTDMQVSISIEIDILKPIQNLVLGFWLISEFGVVLSYVLFDDYIETPNEVTNPGYYIKKFIIPENTLAKGTYYIKFDVGSHNYMGIYQGTLLSFSLMNRGNLGCRFPVGSQMNFSGLFRPKWSIEK